MGRIPAEPNGAAAAAERRARLVALGFSHFNQGSVDAALGACEKGRLPARATATDAAGPGGRRPGSALSCA